MKLLIVGASNYISQLVIKSLKDVEKIVGISVVEDTDRHRDYVELKQDNLDKYFLDIREDFPNWLDKLVEKYGYFDGMIYMPCENSSKPLLEINKEDYDKAVLINGYLPFAISQKLIPGMVKQGQGRIVFISSIWSVMAEKNRNNFDYAITKALMNQTAKQITADCMAEDVTATSLYFGTSEIHQTMHDQKFPKFEGKRTISFEETSEIIVRLLDPKNKSFAGMNLMLDGGDYSVMGVE